MNSLLVLAISFIVSVSVILADEVYRFDKDAEVLYKFDHDGVQIEVLKKGEDCDKKAEEGDMLTAEFHGFLANGYERFESSHDSKKPSSFKIGHGYMIKGLERGLLGTCVGEKRRLHIPAVLAYGKIGDGKNVPPGADLVYDVEVIHIQKGTIPPNIFAKIDLNKDKLISREEMGAFILETGRTVTLRGQSEIDNVVNEIFNLEDINEDGFVDLSEFSGPKKSKHDEL